ncbi:Anaerobic dimethyl sulfoxide reductase chain B, iron-sulfur binding subunit [hydrothermal vent metagenome]|uniref:Anaerobic dimethyl sulfoxide reductase chain B, iron-sulfur binding subunit n=1 Tax=hydrothermal vent metagenome TaxID=652676 RepID=A0A3B0ZRH0_9ZZZZ
MFKVRDDEPDYVFLPDIKSPRKNQYGDDIELAKAGDKLAGKSLNINGDSGISDYPDRYKQHGFYFNADNCISCHACESACSEKNDLPPYLAYRAVGYVEGGTYPSYTRLNISMACNHCDNPVCLKGCPTRAYTKFAEYGAVLQDPDICFGCGYCTWVCPYNAPQLDMEKGHVHKCNMCVDRLEVGLKPACTSACLAGALDFGVIETTPENRDQLKTQIPGFPNPEITHPNIRFQQTKTLPKEMSRTDSTDIKYLLNDKKDAFVPVINETRANKTRHWNLKKLLSSHENAHIAFTLCTQTVIGAFMIFLFSQYMADNKLSIIAEQVRYPVLIISFVLMSTGMLKLNLHLGRPERFYRGFYNLRHSPVSREIAGVSLFFAGLSGFIFFGIFDNAFTRFMAGLSAAAAIIGALAGTYYMYKLYRIPARPFWDHWQTATSFIGSTMSMGGLLILLVALITLDRTVFSTIAHNLLIITLVGMLLEGIGLLAHARAMKHAQHEGALSHFEQKTKYGKSYLFRNVLVVVSITIAYLSYQFNVTGNMLSVSIALLAITSITFTIIGRALFYVLVIPTTMPGAFFWRNKGFEEHARETGLADMPQTGVLPDNH